MSWLAGFFRWLSDFFWPGDWAKDAAKTNFVSYTTSKDAAKLQAAIQNFELAVEQYRKHKNPSLATTLINYAVAVWRQYEDFQRSPDDLDKVISLDTEARKSWSGERNNKTYLFLLSALAGAYFEQYQRAFEPTPIKPDGKQRAFDKAVKYYTELKDNPVAGSQRSATQVQLGVMFRIRSELEQTLDRFEIGVQHLQDALLEATEAGKKIEAGDEGDDAKQGEQSAVNVDDIKATCLLNLAESYEVRYTLVGDPRKVHDLTMAIDSNTRAKPLLEALDRIELPACLFNLARQLRLRWLQTKDQSDYDAAKEMAEAAKDNVDDDDPLKQDIDLLVNVLEPESRQGTLNSVDMYTLGAPSRRGTMHETFENIQIPKRRGTVISMDDISQPRE